MPDYIDHFTTKAIDNITAERRRQIEVSLTPKPPEVTMCRCNIQYVCGACHDKYMLMCQPVFSRHNKAATESAKATVAPQPGEAPLSAIYIARIRSGLD